MIAIGTPNTVSRPCFLAPEVQQRPPMGRRSRDNEIATGIGQFIGVLVLAAFVAFRWQKIPLWIGILLLFSLVGSVALVIFVIKFRSLNRDNRGCAAALHVNPFHAGTLIPPVSTKDDASTLLTPWELMKRVREIDWYQFEKLIEQVYRRLGYQVTRRGGANADGGIDLIIEQAGEATAIQCKHWKTWNVGVKAVREFLGALTDTGIQRGILIAPGGYTDDAKRLADKHRIQLLNELGLVDLFQKTDAGSEPSVRELLADKRKFCPKCESRMVVRTARKGAGTGRKFWGCSAFPRCRFTLTQ